MSLSVNTEPSGTTDDWCPVDASYSPGVTPRETLVEVQHTVHVIKANVQFLLDRVLALEKLVEKVVGNEAEGVPLGNHV